MAQWRKVASGALYHIADDINFRLDPTFHPENNTTLGGDWSEPGIFLTKSPEHWLNGYGYWRPYVIEFTGAVGQDHGSFETFVPATNFSRMSISRVMALDGYCREEFGEWGWTEDYFETYYDTFEPIPEEEMRGYGQWSGYRAPDVRGWSGSWQSKYKARVREFGKTRPGVYA
ncbi:MAG: hypothetical protein R3330_10520 [Saprospiraceae bacterium]|nr:hypothetical protein [Saprospiraceae bacterium]